jgi:hypothetical protein
MVDGKNWPWVIYEAMDQAKEKIRAAYKDKKQSIYLFGRSLITDGTTNSIGLYMQLGIS